MDTLDLNDDLRLPPRLAAVPKADPFITPDDLFERFPHEVQAAIAAQRRMARPVWYRRWALALPVVALIGLGAWWSLRERISVPEVAQVDVTPLSDDELAFMDDAEAQALLDEAPLAGLGEVDLQLNDEELLAYLENEHADITELITEQ